MYFIKYKQYNDSEDSYDMENSRKRRKGEKRQYCVSYKLHVTGSIKQSRISLAFKIREPLNEDKIYDTVSLTTRENLPRVVLGR